MSYTNTSLSTARSCLTKYDFGYNQQLEPDSADAEALQVGQAWHKAFDADDLDDEDLHNQFLMAPYHAIERHAPSPLWNEKLRRLFAAYHWYWRDQPLNLERSEYKFSAEIGGIEFEGQIDGIPVIDGRRGILERKSTVDALDAESSFWDRLRLDVQVGVYSLGCGFTPAFILYDVMRKPTINPKRLTKAEIKRMGAQVRIDGVTKYYDDTFTAEDLEAPLEEGRESIALYGARLTADIGNRPGTYFARREVPRGAQDMKTLQDNLIAQIRVLEHAQEYGLMHRNPDACAARGYSQCTFFGLCSNNIRPEEGDPAPDGFHRREHRHPELAQPAD